jgi:hypothetical protein
MKRLPWLSRWFIFYSKKEHQQAVASVSVVMDAR